MRPLLSVFQITTSADQTDIIPFKLIFQTPHRQNYLRFISNNFLSFTDDICIPLFHYYFPTVCFAY